VCHATNIGPVIGVAKSFQEARQRGAAPGGGKNCVECHFAEVERKLSDGSTRLVRSHALQTPRDESFLRRAFGLQATTDGQSTTVTIENRAGHRVPGLVGRSFRFTVEALDAAGQALAKAEHVIDDRAYLPLDKPVVLVLRAAAASVRVVARHDEPRAAEPVVFLEEALPVEP
jgi:hypothetical protein